MVSTEVQEAPFSISAYIGIEPATLMSLTAGLRRCAATATLPSLLPKAVASVHVGPGRTAEGV